MFIAFHNLVSWWLLALTLVILCDARSHLDKRNPSCETNSECLRKGLPLLPPTRKRFLQRREVLTTDPTCGIEQQLALTVGQYLISVAGASGESGSYWRISGGGGAMINATLDVTSDITLTYFLGCTSSPSTYNSRGEGAGGGTFLYIGGVTVLVAGGGGGGSSNGAQATGGGTNTVDASQGLGASGPTTTASGGSGAGFSSAGNDARPGKNLIGGPGSQSPNFGGTFAGGTEYYPGVGGGGGSGGGGAGGFYHGGGGGGYSGGAGGGVTPADYGERGGRGGGSYANLNLSSRGIVVTLIVASSTPRGGGRGGTIKVERV